ncbi:MAG TPA: chromosomal replication initiator protein DnaA [Rhizobiaceae bacterium]|nr:chromosomal replication initiator protein DnaA [Rhizobiaceae bacterium]
MGDNGSPRQRRAEEVFERVKSVLRARLGQDVYSSWFTRLQLDEASKSIVRLSVPTAFLRSWINNHYIGLIEELWRAEQPEVLRLEVGLRSATRNAPLVAANDEEAQTPKPAAAKPATIAPGLFSSNRPPAQPGFRETDRGGVVSGSPLDPRYSFASFVEGPSNRIALAAARTVAETGAGSVRFNPLFIHASVGLGKTHLLQAIAADTMARDPSRRVVYLTAEYFMWRFATAIRDNNALSFKEQLRNIDLLAIDDMQFLQGKSIQNEFCHLINLLLDSARQVVVAADRPPSELESLDQRVRSRLQGGVALEVSAPDFEMRLSILRRRLEQAQLDDPGIAVDDAIIQHIAHVITGSGRELEGALNQLLFRQSFEPNLSLDRVDFLLGHLVKPGEAKRIRIEDIQRAVSRHYNVTKADMVSARRTRGIVKPRQVAMYLAKALTPRSLPEIGHHFGNRDHTTVLHAVRKIEKLAGEDKTLAKELELLKRLIAEQ